jgi:hypothetical protein
MAIASTKPLQCRPSRAAVIRELLRAANFADGSWSGKRRALWTDAELDVVRQTYPDYIEMRKRLPHRTYWPRVSFTSASAQPPSLSSTRRRLPAFAIMSAIFQPSL